MTQIKESYSGYTTIYYVEDNRGIRMYKSKSAAINAAKQTGGTAYRLQGNVYSMAPIKLV